MLGSLSWTPERYTRPVEAPTYVRTSHLVTPMAGTEVYSRPFFLARPLNEHLARSAISRENQLNHSATRAAGHWKHEQMLDVRERRLKQEHQEAVDVQLELTGDAYLMAFEKRAVERQQKGEAALEEVRTSIQAARDKGTQEYKDWVNEPEQDLGLNGSLALAREKAEHLGRDVFRVSMDVNNDGVIDEDEKFEDPRDLANAYATRLGLKPLTSTTKPDTIKAAYTPYATSLAASRNPPRCRSLLDSTVSEDYQIRHCEDTLREVLQLCCVNHSSRFQTPDGQADLHKWIAHGEVPEFAPGTPKHVIADCLSRVEKWQTELRQMVSTHTRQVAADHCQKLMTFIYLLATVLREHSDIGFRGASYFDQRVDPVFKDSRSASAMKLPNSPVFVRR